MPRKIKYRAHITVTIDALYLKPGDTRREKTAAKNHLRELIKHFRLPHTSRIEILNTAKQESCGGCGKQFFTDEMFPCFTLNVSKGEWKEFHKDTGILPPSEEAMCESEKLYCSSCRQGQHCPKCNETLSEFIAWVDS